MKITYTGLDGSDYSEELERIVPKGPILHATSSANIPSILENGLLIGQPRVKLMVDIQAIFCTIPSPKPSRHDLFRIYSDWSAVVLDSSVIPNHIWYKDFLAVEDTRSHALNQHIFTFQDIPPEAIMQVINLAN